MYFTHLIYIYHKLLNNFSYSCGYRKVYEEYVSILRQKYPQLQIDGENFNPPGYNMLIAKILVNILFSYLLYI